MLELIVYLVLFPLLCVISAALGALITLYFARKYMKKELNTLTADLGDDIFKSTMPLLEDGINDSDIVDTLISRMFESLQKSFASQKGATVRRQNGLSKRVVNYLLDQAPMAKIILTEVGGLEMVQKDPSLLIWGMQKFPWLFNQGETQSINTINSINQPVNNYGQGTTEEIRQDGVQEGLGGLQTNQV